MYNHITALITHVDTIHQGDGAIHLSSIINLSSVAHQSHELWRPDAAMGIQLSKIQIVSSNFSVLSQYSNSAFRLHYAMFVFWQERLEKGKQQALVIIGTKKISCNKCKGND